MADEVLNDGVGEGDGARVEDHTGRIRIGKADGNFFFVHAHWCHRGKRKATALEIRKMCIPCVGAA
jgi:hypothetical protein